MFFKRKDSTEEKIDNMIHEIIMLSALNKAQLEAGNVEWTESVIQDFLPIVLRYTSWDWLDLIAKHELLCEEYSVVKNFLKKAEMIVENNQKILSNKMEAEGWHR